VEGLIRLIQASTGLDEAQARQFHLEMWIYVHGMATMIATGYLSWDENQADAMLTDAYRGFVRRYHAKEGT
jgi:hypothetical protein